MADPVKWIDGKKYMWDGKTYGLEGETLETAALYAKARFDVQVVHGEGEYLIYTRRTVEAAAVQ